MIKNIIFDIGGVLVNFHPVETLAQMNLSDDEIKTIANGTALNPIWSELDRGVLPKEEVFKIMLEGIPSAYKKSAEVFLNEKIMQTVTSFDYAESLVKDLKEKGYKIYLLTNYPEFMFTEHFKTTFTFSKYVDGMIVSAVEKFIKPDAEIYKRLLSRYNLNPEESVFIDDRLENIEGARKLGINGIHFTNIDSVKAQLNELLSK